MAPVDELIERYAELKPLVDAGEAELKELTTALREHFAEGRGQIITSQGGVKMRMDGRNRLNDEKLKDQLTPSLWNSVSKRVSVATLIKAAIVRGKIKQEDVDSCMEPIKTWFKVL